MIFRNKHKLEFLVDTFNSIRQTITFFSEEKELVIASEEITKEDNYVLGEELSSVFYPLYKKTSDIDIKLMLIQQMGLLGHEKERAFLQFLNKEANSKISESIKKALDELNARIAYKGIGSIAHDSSIEKIKNYLKTNPDIDSTDTIEGNRLPLELCFLYYEFGINASKEKDIDFDFELSEEFLIGLKC